MKNAYFYDNIMKIVIVLLKLKYFYLMLTLCHRVHIILFQLYYFTVNILITLSILI